MTPTARYFHHGGIGGSGSLTKKSPESQAPQRCRTLADMVRRSPTLTTEQKEAFEEIEDALLDRDAYDWLKRMRAEGFDRNETHRFWHGNRTPVDMDERHGSPFGHHQQLLDTGLRLWLWLMFEEELPEEARNLFSD